jgi:hypothetical protein
MRAGVTVLRSDEVAELHWVANEEDRCVVSYEVPIAILGVELHRETSRIASGVGRSALARHGGKAGEQLRRLSRRR